MAKQKATEHPALATGMYARTRQAAAAKRRKEKQLSVMGRVMSGQAPRPGEKDYRDRGLPTRPDRQGKGAFSDAMTAHRKPGRLPTGPTYPGTMVLGSQGYDVSKAPPGAGDRKKNALPTGPTGKSHAAVKWRNTGEKKDALPTAPTRPTKSLAGSMSQPKKDALPTGPQGRGYDLWTGGAMPVTDKTKKLKKKKPKDVAGQRR